ncbi:MAG: lipoyl(octanoyl) transferase LipB [Enterobacterales bacterium]|nr:lipoyl(octanoyl) transferase LipB [Enterobacterales bacterium]
MNSQQDYCIVRQLNRQAYLPVWKAMQNFTQQRDQMTSDEIWLVEHEPVFTQGQAGKSEHLLSMSDIPVIQVDRGGQITYHGPGQQVVYFLIDLKRKNFGVRKLVTAIEQSVVGLLNELKIDAMSRADAPGVYVAQKKIASVGLKIKRGCSFHGLALNVAMDKTPFEQINPCGYAGLAVTQLSELSEINSLEKLQPILLKSIMKNLDYKSYDTASRLQFLD